MVKNKEFSREETVLLLDAYLLTLSGEKTKKEAVELCSNRLRSMAERNGEKIDSTFRNIGGIGYQMAAMDAAYHGNSIGPSRSAPRLFCEIVDLYRNDRAAYNRLLKEARFLAGDQDAKDHMNAEAEFVTWLSKKISADQMTQCFLALHEIENHAINMQLISQSVYETSNVERIKRIRTELETGRGFKYKSEKDYEHAISAVNYLIEFIQGKPEPVKKCAEDHAPYKIEKTAEQNQQHDYAEVQKDPILAYLEENGLEYIDVRQKGGCIWILGGNELAEKMAGLRMLGVKVYFKEGGGKISEGRDAWWTTGRTSKTEAAPEEDLIDIAIRKEQETEVEEQPAEEEQRTDAGEQPVEKSSTPVDTSEKETYPDPEMPKEPEAERSTVPQTFGRNYTRLNFTDIPSLLFIKPAYLTYYSDIYPVKNWKEVFIKGCQLLVEDYPDIFSKLRQTCIDDEDTMWLVDESHLKELREPILIAEDYYIETNRGATALMRLFKSVLDACSVDQDDLVVYYNDGTRKNSTEKERIDSSKQTRANPPAAPKDETKPQMTPVEKKDANSDKRMRFISWLMENHGLKAQEAKDCLAYIRASEKVGNVHLFPGTLTDVYESGNALCSNKKFISLNNKYSQKLTKAISLLASYYGGRWVPNIPSEETPEQNTQAPKPQESSTGKLYILRINGTDYQGSTPSEAFLLFCEEMGYKRRTDMLRASGIRLKGYINAPLNKYRPRGGLKIESINAYVDPNLNAQDVRVFSKWVLEQCGESASEIEVFFSSSTPERTLSQVPTVSSTPTGKEAVHQKREKSDDIPKVNQKPVGNSTADRKPGTYTQTTTGSSVYRSDKTQEQINALLTEEFPDGLRPISMRLRKFRNLYEERYHEALPENEDYLKSVLQKVAVYREERFFARQTTDSSVIDEIIEQINKAWRSGASCIYLECILERNRKRLAEELSVYNTDSLRSLLLERDKSLHEKSGYLYMYSREANTGSDVRRTLEASHEPLDYNQLQQILWYIPLEKIKQNLMWDSALVNVDRETYFYAPNIPVSEEELQKISIEMHREIANKGFVVAKDLPRIIRTASESAAINTAQFLDWGLRNIFSYILKDEYDFSLSLVCEKGKRIQMWEAYRDFCRDHEQLSLDELKEFSSMVGVQIYWDTVLNEMVRVSASQLVRKDMIHFNVKETDAVLDRLCAEDYTPIKQINLFLQFPATEYVWNGFVLESYLRYASQAFKLVQVSISDSDYYGLIVRRNSRFQDYRDIIVDTLARNRTWKDKDSALQLLVDLGYQARKYLTGVEENMKDALLIREKMDKNER